MEEKEFDLAKKTDSHIKVTEVTTTEKAPAKVKAEAPHKDESPRKSEKTQKAQSRAARRRHAEDQKTHRYTRRLHR